MCFNEYEWNGLFRTEAAARWKSVCRTVYKWWNAIRVDCTSPYCHDLVAICILFYYCLLWYGEKTTRNRKQTTVKATRRKFCVYAAFFPFYGKSFDTTRTFDWIESDSLRSSIFFHFDLFPILGKQISSKFQIVCEWTATHFDPTVFRNRKLSKPKTMVAIKFPTPHSFGLNIISNHRAFICIINKAIFQFIHFQFYHFIESKWIKHLRCKWDDVNALWLSYCYS